MTIALSRQPKLTARGTRSMVRRLMVLVSFCQLAKQRRTQEELAMHTDKKPDNSTTREV